MKVEVAVLGSPSLIVSTVSVDVKQHLKKLRAKELCKSRGGHPGFPPCLIIRTASLDLKKHCTRLVSESDKGGY